MLVTPPVVDSCTQQYQHPKPMPTPALTPNTNTYAPSQQDADKIQTTIDTLERVKRSQNSSVTAEDIDKIINQLNMDLMYFKLKHGK
jgi:hypothetical protein